MTTDQTDRWLRPPDYRPPWHWWILRAPRYGAAPPARRTRRIVRALAAGTWSAMQTYGALVMASYGYVAEPEPEVTDHD